MIPLTDQRYFKVSIEELTTPKTGYTTILGNWWEVIDGSVLGLRPYGPKSKWECPQCNVNRHITDKLKHPECESVLIPVAYWPYEY